MPPDETTRWILIGAAAAAAFYLLVLRPKLQKRRGNDALERSSEQGALSRQRGVEREMSGVLVELTEMTRQVGAQLDTRAARLEVLIQQADQRIATLQSISPQRGPDANASSPLGAQGGSLNASYAASADPRTTATASVPVDPRHAEVYALADQGNSPPEIAARLGRPNGEIQLILALRSRG